MFMNLAHRGASAYAPENTMSAFCKSIEFEADGIETDVRISKDGHLILFHDKTIDNKTNGTGTVSQYTLKELMALDTGSWFSEKYKGERLVTLEEFLHFFGRHDIIFAIELKEIGIEKQVLDLIYKYDIKEKTTITSFSYENIREVRKIDSDIDIGQLIKKIDVETIDKLKAIGAKQICPKAILLEKKDVILAKQHNFSVRAWGVKDEALMKKMLDFGVDGMTVNFPDKLKAYLER